MGAQLDMNSGQRGGSARARYGRRPMAEINVTPFVDVMLVLLIVFMVTAPLLTAGVPIDLPDSKAKSIKEEDNKPLEVSLDSDGKIFVGEQEVTQERLVNMLSSITGDDQERRIYIRADKGLDYGHVMGILGDINGAGFRKVALISNAK